MMSNFYTSKYPESYFRHNLIICLHTFTGRKTLMNKKFNNIDGEKIITIEAKTALELRKIIKTEFHLEVPKQINLEKILDF